MPAFVCVTLRTASSALARLRSMSFWRFLTFRWFPSLEARKMRCLRLLTISLVCRQSTAFQSVRASVPFA